MSSQTLWVITTVMNPTMQAVPPGLPPRLDAVVEVLADEKVDEAADEVVGEGGVEERAWLSTLAMVGQEGSLPAAVVEEEAEGGARVGLEVDAGEVVEVEALVAMPRQRNRQEWVSNFA